MPEDLKLNKPWLVAVWPGMGQVAVSAGYYLVSKLETRLLTEFTPDDLFDVEHVEVKGGLIRSGALPRNRLFVWNDPAGERDLVIFLGEAQPKMGKYGFCRKLIDYAKELGVERVFTFAAMGTGMRPEHDSRVFAAAADEETLEELRPLDLEVLEEGHIGGLNGVLLGVAAEAGLRGACLLGEMPHVFAQRLPFPKASLAVLQAFGRISGIEVDLDELADQAKAVEEQLSELLEQVEKSIGETESEEVESFSLEPEEERLDPEDEQRIERLFEQAEQDRSKAYELKQELDRLDVFKDYEDRFLDLFKK